MRNATKRDAQHLPIAHWPVSEPLGIGVGHVGNEGGAGYRLGARRPGYGFPSLSKFVFQVRVFPFSPFRCFCFDVTCHVHPNATSFI